jgi:hypothetical protein
VLYGHHTLIKWTHNNEFVSVRQQDFIVETIPQIRMSTLTLLTELIFGENEL